MQKVDFLMRDAQPLHGPNFTEETFLKALDDGKFPNVDIKKYTTLIDDDMGKVVFPTLDNAKKMALVKRLKELKMDDEVITDLFGNLSSIRGKWSELFEDLGGTLRGEDLASFKKLFGKKFTDYLRIYLRHLYQ